MSEEDGIASGMSLENHGFEMKVRRMKLNLKSVCDREIYEEPQPAHLGGESHALYIPLHELLLHLPRTTMLGTRNAEKRRYKESQEKVHRCVHRTGPRTNECTVPYPR